MLAADAAAAADVVAAAAVPNGGGTGRSPGVRWGLRSSGGRSPNGSPEVSPARKGRRGSAVATAGRTVASAEQYLAEPSRHAPQGRLQLSSSPLPSPRAQVAPSSPTPAGRASIKEGGARRKSSTAPAQLFRRISSVQAGLARSSMRGSTFAAARKTRMSRLSIHVGSGGGGGELFVPEEDSEGDEHEENRC
jgi:hypothetical protein